MLNLARKPKEPEKLHMTARLSDVGYREGGKLMRSASYKKMHAEPDQPMKTLIAKILHILILECEWSCRENAEADLLYLKNYINGLSVPKDEGVSRTHDNRTF